ncbi:hypothetical protein UPYG_G00331170 [Umbra pygmaea]|uniref:GBD/FH3 domain-containing protein n=1 Tax=Umbra pygmaea TaxID=75934 RepID=A0ABD0VZP1_UMBPY
MATFVCRVQFLDDTDPFNSTNFPEPTRPPHFTFREDIPLINQIAGVHRLLRAPHKLDDCALQLSHNGSYLDLESSLAEQRDELEGFQQDTAGTRGKKHSVVLRTQLTVRVHACIEKLYNSNGRDLRRALFSLKQIFQDDKDLVHEFVMAEGLTCLIKVGAEADQNYQNYILRALGQIMLYVDGMNGVTSHIETIQWLYALIGSKFRLVVKTALKLLLVFVEYSESNAPLLIDAITTVDTKRGCKPWSNAMEILAEKDGVDTELLVYTTTLINKTLSALPDQDSFYDMVDVLEEQGIEGVAKRFLGRRGTDLDLMEQLNIYEATLRHEDGDDDDSQALNGLSGRTDRRRISLGGGDKRRGLERRRSRRASLVRAGNSPACSPSPQRAGFQTFNGGGHQDLSEREEEEDEDDELPITESDSDEEEGLSEEPLRGSTLNQTAGVDSVTSSVCITLIKDRGNGAREHKEEKINSSPPLSLPPPPPPFSSPLITLTPPPPPPLSSPLPLLSSPTLPLTSSIKSTVSIYQPVPINQHVPVNHPVAINEPVPIYQPVPVNQHIPVNHPVPINQPVTVYQPVPISEHVPINQPISVNQPSQLAALLASRKSTVTIPASSQVITRGSNHPSPERLPYLPHSPFHLFSYDLDNEPSSPTPKCKLEMDSKAAAAAARNGIQWTPSTTTDKPALGGLLSSSYRQHQESLAAERERRRAEREERLLRIEREERNKHSRDHVDKMEEARMARDERYKHVERLAAEEFERDHVPRSRPDFSLNFEPAYAWPPSSSRGSSPSSQASEEPDQDPREPDTEPEESPEELKPEDFTSCLEPEGAELETGREDEEVKDTEEPKQETEEVKDIRTTKEGEEEQEDSGILSDKERQNEDVNEKDNCSASSISSASSTLEREERERADNGQPAQSVKEAGVNEQCSDILQSKRFMLDMLYCQSTQPCEEEEKEDGERGKEDGEASHPPGKGEEEDENARKADSPEKHPEKTGSHLNVRAFAERFGDLVKGLSSPHPLDSPSDETADVEKETPPPPLRKSQTPSGTSCWPALASSAFETWTSPT